MADLPTPPLAPRELEGDAPDAPLALLSSVKEFAAAHGGATATVEYEGKRGARVVLVGSDGASADAYADATDVARHACRTAGVDVINTWEQELFEEIRTQAAIW